MATADEEACLELTNKLIIDCHLAHPRISSMNGISSDLFCQLFDAICGIPIPGLPARPRSEADEALRVQSIIDALSRDVLRISLSHISGWRVAARDPRSVLDLLQVLEAWHDLRGEDSRTESSPSRLSTSIGSTGSTGSSGVCSDPPCFVCEFVKSRSAGSAETEPEGRRRVPDWGSPIAAASSSNAASKLREPKVTKRALSATRLPDLRRSCRSLSPLVPPDENLPPAPRGRFLEEQRVPDAGPTVRKRPRVVKKSVLLPPRPGRSKRRRSDRGPDDGDDGDLSASPTTEEALSPHAERTLRTARAQSATLAARMCAGHVGTSVARLDRKHAELLRRHSRHVEGLRKELGDARRRNYLEAQRNVYHAVRSLQAERRQLAAKMHRRREEHDRIVAARREGLRNAHQQMLYEAFRESLRTQKEDLQEVRNAAREKTAREEERHRARLAALENFYGSQLSLLSEALAREKMELKQRARAQSRVLERMKREFQEKMEAETNNLYRQFADDAGAALPRSGLSRKQVGPPSQK